MPVNYTKDLSIAPLPMDPITAAVLAQVYASKIAGAGGRQQAARIAVEAMEERLDREPPSQHSRLQRLYSQVYTRAELERLMLNTFDALGLGD